MPHSKFARPFIVQTACESFAKPRRKPLRNLRETSAKAPKSLPARKMRKDGKVRKGFFENFFLLFPRRKSAPILQRMNFAAWPNAPTVKMTGYNASSPAKIRSNVQRMNFAAWPNAPTVKMTGYNAS